jgi:hypothetical protein
MSIQRGSLHYQKNDCETHSSGETYMGSSGTIPPLIFSAAASILYTSSPSRNLYQCVAMWRVSKIRRTGATPIKELLISNALPYLQHHTKN